MFKTNAATNRLLARASVAYVKQDGVIIGEEKYIGPKQYRTKIDVWHVYPCEIGFRGTNYKGHSWLGKTHETTHDPQPTTLIYFDPKLLIGGLERVEVSYYSKSEAMEKKGIQSTGIWLYAPNGQEIRISAYPFSSSQVEVRPDPLNDPYSLGEHTNSIVELADYFYTKYNDKVIWHGERPEEVTE